MCYYSDIISSRDLLHHCCFSPEGLGAVCGCVFLMAMFLFIPIPSFITMATLDNQVCWSIPYRLRYLNSTNGQLSVFNDFIFINGSAKRSGTAMGLLYSWFFQGVKFHQ